MDNSAPYPIPINSDEFLSSIMVYTNNEIMWGEVVIKKQFRASRWLITNAVPEIIHLYNTKSLPVIFSGTPKPISSLEAFIPLTEIRLFHLVPPNFDPIDIDRSDTNMKMLSVRIQSGAFQIEGGLWISNRASLSSYLDILHQAFLEIYDGTIAASGMPSFGKVKIPHALVRKDSSIISLIAN